MNDFIDYLKGLPWKDWATPLIGGFLALTGVVYSATLKASNDRKDKRAAIEAQERVNIVAQTHDMTDRFKALMDGYDNHVESLSVDLNSTKAELRETRQEYEALKRLYNDHMEHCPKRGRHA